MNSATVHKTSLNPNMCKFSMEISLLNIGIWVFRVNSIYTSIAQWNKNTLQKTSEHNYACNYTCNSGFSWLTSNDMQNRKKKIHRLQYIAYLLEQKKNMLKKVICWLFILHQTNLEQFLNLSCISSNKNAATYKYQIVIIVIITTDKL